VKKLFFYAAALAALFVGTSTAMAQVGKPAVIVSVTSYDELMADIDYLGQATGLPMISSAIVEANVTQITNGQGLKGLDKKKPWGGVLMVDGENYVPMVFLPVSDVKGLVEGFAAMGVEITTESDGTFTIASPAGMPISAKTSGEYTFFAQDAEKLAKLPADPVSLLGGLNKTHDIGVRAYVQNVPAEKRAELLDGLKEGMRRSLREEDGVSPEALELRKKMVENQIKEFDTAAAELDTITFGLKIDSAEKVVNLDTAGTAVASSKMAEQFGSYATTTSEFQGFQQPGAAVNLTSTSLLNANQIEQMVSVVRTLEGKAQSEIEKDEHLTTDEDRAAAKEGVGALISAMIKTIETGKLDFGGTVMLEPESATFAGGAGVADGAAVEAAFKKIAAVASKGDKDFPEFKFDAETYKGVRFHTATVPVPDASAQAVFGENMDIVVGIGPKVVYVSAGSKAADVLKKVIDKSATDGAKPARMLNLVASLAPMFEFANSIEKNPMTEALAASLKTSEGKDHISMSSIMIPRGVVYRLQVESGVLKLIGQAALPLMMGGGRRGPGPGGF